MRADERRLPRGGEETNMSGYAWMFAMGACAVLWGCASRALPKSYPAEAPVSRQVPEAWPADVTRALAADPPLPGEAASGWPGLAEDEASAGASDRNEDETRAGTVERKDDQLQDGGAAGEAPAQRHQGHEHHHGGHHQHGAH